MPDTDTNEGERGATRVRSAREEELRTSLYEMLEAYWGKGDGHEPPEFIKRAQALVGGVRTGNLDVLNETPP